MLFLFCTPECRRGGYSRAPGRQLEATTDARQQKRTQRASGLAPCRPYPFFLLTRGDNRNDQTTRRSQFSLMFIAFQVDGTVLDKETFIRGQRTRRESEVEQT